MMRTTIQATCPTCGHVTLASDDVELLIDGGSRPDSYAFHCPECRVHVRKDADERVVRLLQSAGVACRSLAPAPPARPALTEDDLYALHRLLQTDDWFAEVLALVRGNTAD